MLQTPSGSTVLLPGIHRHKMNPCPAKHSLKLQHQSKFIINGATLDLQTDKIQKETFIQRHQAFYLCVISVCFELLTGFNSLYPSA